jgi:fatty acid desaturase
MSPLKSIFHHVVGETLSPTEFDGFYAESRRFLKILLGVWVVLGLSAAAAPAALGWGFVLALLGVAVVAGLLVAAAIHWLYHQYQPNQDDEYEDEDTPLPRLKPE